MANKGARKFETAELWGTVRPVERFEITVYHAAFNVFCGSPVPESSDRELDGLFGQPSLAAGGMTPFFWFRDGNPEPGLVAHECLHGALWLLTTIGCRLCFERFLLRGSDEPLCYLTGHMVGQCYDALSRLKGRKR